MYGYYLIIGLIEAAVGPCHILIPTFGLKIHSDAMPVQVPTCNSTLDP